MTRLFYLLCLTALLSSCSLGFKREWKAALKAGPKSGIEGAWQGTWNSESSGHHGKLRSVIGPAKNAEGSHTVHYHAIWAGFLSGAYRVDHQVKKQNGRDHWEFEGQHKMPDWAGGLYTYRGTVKGDIFSARYQCALDEGTFDMTRVK